MIPWKNQRQRHPEMEYQINERLSDVIDRLYHALTDPFLRSYMKPAFRGDAPLERLEGCMRGLLNDLRFRWCSPTVRRQNASAQKYPQLMVAFNHHALFKWQVTLSPDEFQARLTDLLLHEIGHLADWIFCGGWGHQESWKRWGIAAGFVPLGSTQYPQRKVAMATRLHETKTKEIQQTGVRKSKDGWIWSCPTCDRVSSVFTSRDLARQSYKIHRAETCQGDRGLTVSVGSKRRKSKVDVGMAPTIWRLGEVINPKTKRPSVLKLCRDGKLTPSDQARVGVKYAKKWVEVRARSRAEALELIAAGKGEKKSR